jgi:hypothetical protein
MSAKIFSITMIGSLGLILATDKKPVPLLPQADNFTGMKQLGGTARYQVQNGVVTGTSTLGTPNSFMATEKEYGDFELEYEFMIDRRLNSGVQIRSQSRPDYQNGRVHGYQIEIDPSPRGWTGGLYDESRRGWLQNMEGKPEVKTAFKANEWNHVKVRAFGAHLQSWVNGVPATNAYDAQTQKGFVALQVHNIKQPEQNGTQVQWRNLKISDLGEHEWQPLFDGKSLSGWSTAPGAEWKIIDGVLSGTQTASETRSGALVSEAEHADFTLRAVFRQSVGHSAVAFRAMMPPSGEKAAGLRTIITGDDETGGLYNDEQNRALAPTDKKLMQEKKVYRPGEWNELWISAHGPRTVIHVNGILTVDRTDALTPPKGKITLALPGGEEAKVEYKSIEHLVPKKN